MYINLCVAMYSSPFPCDFLMMSYCILCNVVPGYYSDSTGLHSRPFGFHSCKQQQLLMVMHYLHTVMTVCGKIGSDFILEVL